jgi:hypothetical protein
MLGEPIVLVICAVALCGVGLVGSVLLNFFSIFLNILGGLLGLAFEVLGSGPVGWCGCAVVVGLGCGIIWLISYLLTVIPNCGTPEAVNLCRLLGY